MPAVILGGPGLFQISFCRCQPILRTIHHRVNSLQSLSAIDTFNFDNEVLQTTKTVTKESSQGGPGFFMNSA